MNQKLKNIKNREHAFVESIIKKLKKINMLQLMNDLPENVIGISAEGKVTGKDYEEVLIPAVEQKLKTNPKIRMLYHLGDTFVGFNLRANT